jgi:SAM-dependent methyltransferase
VVRPTPFEQEVDAGEYLLRLATSPMGRTYKSLALQQLGLGPGAAVLDLGCGPGTDLAAFAEAVGPTGIVVGLDHDETAVGRARRRTAHLPQVQVRHGEVEALPMADGSFDAVHTDRLLQHVTDPAAAVAEAGRVLRVGARAVLVEPDWRTLLIDHPDARLPSIFARYVHDHQVRNPRIGSQLARLGHGAGLAVETVVPVTTVFDDPVAADQVLGFHRVTQRVVDRGLMSAADGERWLDHLARGQPFFASVTLFLVVAVKASAAF